MHYAGLIASIAALTGVVAAQEYPSPAQFQAWNWDCNARGSHTLGTFIGDRQDQCLPLQTGTRGIDVQHLEEGCTRKSLASLPFVLTISDSDPILVTFFSDALCDPSLPKAYREGPRTGCLWTDMEYKSYKLTCGI